MKIKSIVQSLGSLCLFFVMFVLNAGLLIITLNIKSKTHIQSIRAYCSASVKEGISIMRPTDVWPDTPGYKFIRNCISTNLEIDDASVLNSTGRDSKDATSVVCMSVVHGKTGLHQSQV